MTSRPVSPLKINTAMQVLRNEVLRFPKTKTISPASLQGLGNDYFCITFCGTSVNRRLCSYQSQLTADQEDNLAGLSSWIHIQASLYVYWNSSTNKSPMWTQFTYSFWFKETQWLLSGNTCCMMQCSRTWSLTKLEQQFLLCRKQCHKMPANQLAVLDKVVHVFQHPTKCCSAQVYSSGCWCFRCAQKANAQIGHFERHCKVKKWACRYSCPFG